jgi:hypothetical protein
LEQSGAVIERQTDQLVCPRCASGREVDLPSEALDFLRAAAARPPERLDEVALSPRAGRQLATAHRVLIATHLDKELKSARVLRELGVSTDAGLSELRTR